jgi:hypothetical protein
MNDRQETGLGRRGRRKKNREEKWLRFSCYTQLSPAKRNSLMIFSLRSLAPHNNLKKKKKDSGK